MNSVMGNPHVKLQYNQQRVGPIIRLTERFIRITFSVLCQGTYNNYIFTILTCVKDIYP